jgi:hypothetical protein
MEISKGAGARSHKRVSRGMSAGVVLAAGLIAGSLALPAAAQGLGDEFAQAFKDGTFNVNFRYRYEFADNDFVPGITENSNASTLRTRLVFKSAEFKNTFLTLNVDDVRPVIASDFNDTRNGKTQYTRVFDPKGTDLNLASLTFTGLNNANIVAGRQRIKRADDRFIGNVGWRQNEQTYDALSIDYAPIESLKFFYAYIDRVKRIFGPNDGVGVAGSSAGAFAANFSSKSHLFDVGFTFNEAVALFGYAYLLDLDSNKIPGGSVAANVSSQTIGGKVSGAPSFGDNLKLKYIAEYAYQEDYANNPNKYDENYYRLQAGLDWSRWGIKAGYEVLGGNGTAGQSFQTPLATLHAFQGWADLFVVNPDGGLKDAYVGASAKILKANMVLLYHNFKPDTGSGTYGTEVDFAAKWAIGKHYSVLAKLAYYDADTFSVDTTKAWLQFTAAF